MYGRLLPVTSKARITANLEITVKGNAKKWNDRHLRLPPPPPQRLFLAGSAAADRPRSRGLQCGDVSGGGVHHHLLDRQPGYPPVSLSKYVHQHLAGEYPAGDSVLSDRLRDDGAVWGYQGEPLPEDPDRRGGGGDGGAVDIHLPFVFQRQQDPPEHVLRGVVFCLCVHIGGKIGAAVFLCDLQIDPAGELQP